MSEIELANKELAAASARLSEHFDSVQIICTKLCPDGSTDWVAWGKGDFYARKGACRDFLEKSDARTLAYILNEQNRS